MRERQSETEREGETDRQTWRKEMLVLKCGGRKTNNLGAFGKSKVNKIRNVVWSCREGTGKYRLFPGVLIQRLKEDFRE